MRRLLSSLGLLALALASGAPGLRAQSDNEPRVIMISIDGMMPSAYTQAGPARIPAVRRLARDGAFAEGVVGVLPTVTYPSHTTLLTGVPPSIHGIVDNRMFDPEGASGGANYWYERDVQAPTILGAVHGRGWRTAAVAWPVTVGMDVDYHVPEFSPRADSPVDALVAQTPARIGSR